VEAEQHVERTQASSQQELPTAIEVFPGSRPGIGDDVEVARRDGCGVEQSRRATHHHEVDSALA